VLLLTLQHGGKFGGGHPGLLSVATALLVTPVAGCNAFALRE